MTHCHRLFHAGVPTRLPPHWAAASHAPGLPRQAPKIRIKRTYLLGNLGGKKRRLVGTDEIEHDTMRYTYMCILYLCMYIYQICTSEYYNHMSFWELKRLSMTSEAIDRN